ncbi:hypothetical protein CfE428DRAFT_4046 [Chthoniobacter flavus Ellin428]|uniref:Peptidase C-terminal archaeal/bacterial domain-containing protein n=1 Tax=Chthoniobacter flavus Ellin428 TaxID=497964 RepID=B4D557_9BACT|nr:PPC domain-containing protein [Chthoniobacter flavus]EDY18262.1 hypothetical protein CfE428DRAFT_4046 [Chthoniobacter flavus Ellin428]TCO91292.1 pre-peptidase [Chthoniobacter flavus]
MKRFIQSAVAICGLLASILTAHAQEIPVPELQHILPCGAKRGTTVEVELNGSRLDETKKLYFSNPGITAELISDPAKLPARFKVTVAANVPVGVYDVRSAGKMGVSNPRAFDVSDCAEVMEKEPNNTRDKANRVPLNCIINGTVSPAEDIDWFVFEAKRGQRVLIESLAWRLDSRLDGTLVLFNSAGKEIASNQDANIRDQKRDPFIDFDVPEDGDYYVRFTDFMYNGGEDCFYRLKISTGPYLDFITPSGAKPGTTADITFYGRNLPGGEKTDVQVNGRPLEKVVRKIEVPSDSQKVTGLQVNELVRPPSSRLDGMEVRVSGDTGTSNARMLVYSDSPELLQQRPNDSIEHTQHIPVPCAVTGAFNAPKDAGYYTFSAKKGEKYLIDVASERINSPADPDLEIYENDGKPEGKLINSYQDTGENIGQLRFPTMTRDIVYLWTAPKDADFTLRLEHVYSQVQGGPQYQYRLEIKKDPAPDFRLVCTPTHDIHIDSSCVYQGGRQRLDVLVWRMNDNDAPIEVEAQNLPPGVTADPIVIGPGVKWGTLVVNAAPDAPIGEAEIKIVGTCQVGSEKLVREARGGTIVWNTVNTPAICRITKSIMLAVRETTPFAVTASTTDTAIKAGDPIKVKVTAARRADMPSAIQLTGTGYDLPPGLTIPTTTINPGQTEATLTVATTDKTKEGTYSFIINAESQVPTSGDKKMRVIYPSNPIKITVAAKPAK